MKNSKNWNRILTGAAAVSLAIGTMAPMAFAASATSQYNTRTMNVGSGFTAVVSGLVAQDQGHATEFLPIYYLMQGLGKMGYTVNWNGGTRVLNITTPTGVTVTAPTATVGTPGANQMVIQLNGANVMLAPRVVAKDQASGVMTTFAPIYYLNQALKSAGFTNTYNGSSWTLNGQAASQTGTLSASMTVSNQTNGTGTVSSPAVSLKDTAISLSTSLKDASGNPLPNTAVTFNVSNYGNYPSQLPVVENASGTVISGTQQSTAEQYTVFTNTDGVATVSMTGPSGETYAYEVVATAPYAGANQSTVTSQPAYLEFVQNNYAGIAPYASSTQMYNAAMNAAVPITVILPPNAAGQPQANVLLTLEVTAPNNSSLTSSHASFVTSTGAVQGAQIQVSTNSSGIATAYLSDAYSEAVEVQVSAGLPSGVNQPNPTYLNFAQTGIPSQVNNFSISSTGPNIGENVYVSGQLEDASGNPVPNGQILVTSPNTGSNDFAYVSGTTTTAFPLISSALSSNTPATSAYGDVVTADANGNFSFAVTDPRAETQTYSIYPVSNGEVSGSPITTGVPSNDLSITFAPTSTLGYLSIGALDTYVQTNNSTTLTGLTAQVDNGAGGLGQLSNPNDTGSNPQISDVYVEPQNQSGHHKGNVNESATYNLSISNGGLIYSINGVTLNNPSSAVTVNYTPASSAAGIGAAAGTAAGTYTVNGQTIGSLTNTSLLWNAGYATNALPEDFEIGVVNNNTGATTLTAQSGSISSTASINFQGGTPVQVTSFAPGNATVAGGQSQTVSFQVEDYTGNPVPNVAATIATDAQTDPFFITQVNGVTLQEQLNMGSTSTPSYATEATPIPLGSVADTLNYSVSMPGVAQWTNPVYGTNTGNTITVYSNASGNVTLTLQAGGLNYPSQEGSQTGSGSAAAPGNPTNAVNAPASSGSLAFYTDTNGDTNSGIPSLIMTVGGSTGVATTLNNISTGLATAASAGPNKDSATVAQNFILQGSLGWGNGAATAAYPGGTYNFGSQTSVSMTLQSGQSYTIDAPSATSITLTGSATNVTVNAPNAVVTNNANVTGTYTIDPSSFTNTATIGTLVVTQATSVTVTNSGSGAISAVQITPSAAASGAQYEFVGTSIGTVTLENANAAGATIAVPAGTGITNTAAVAYNYAQVSSTGTVGTSTSVSSGGIGGSPAGTGYSSVTSAVYGTTTTVAGVIKDASGNPVPNQSVVVAINGTYSSATTTNASGLFTATVGVTTSSGQTVTVSVFTSTSLGSSALIAPSVTLS